MTLPGQTATLRDPPRRLSDPSFWHPHATDQSWLDHKQNGLNALDNEFAVVAIVDRLGIAAYI
jgi:hypothetical protein